MNKNKIRRAFASYDGNCPFGCLHCYTYIDEFNSKGHGDISEIICGLEKQIFDIVYISGYKENFHMPNEGIDLIEKIFDKFTTNILFTTRNIFDNIQIERLSEINKVMQKKHKSLVACVSISARDSYKKIEPSQLIPSPDERIDFIKKLYKENILTLLTLRPVFPEIFIPTDEYLSIIDSLQNNCSGVISSGVVINDEIKKRLYGFPQNYNYVNKPLMHCLDQNDISMQYVDVSNELDAIKKRCKDRNIFFFSESLEAINYYLKF